MGLCSSDYTPVVASLPHFGKRRETPDGFTVMADLPLLSRLLRRGRRLGHGAE